MKKVVECEHCKYTWTTKSEMFKVCCPKCGKKTNIEGNKNE